MNNLAVIKSEKLDGPKALADQLRALADELEAEGTARTAFVVIDKHGDVDFACCGYRPRKSEAVGLLAYAQNMVLTDA